MPLLELTRTIFVLESWVSFWEDEPLAKMVILGAMLVLELLGILVILVF